MALDYYPKMWFGTFHHSEWIDAPLSGANMSSIGWGSTGVYLGGGGFAFNSADAHKEYVFDWRGTSSRAAAIKMQSFRDGVYSKDAYRDLFYFHDPLTTATNVLPKRWAQPSINVGYGRDRTPLGYVTRIDTPEPLLARGLPLTGVEVDSWITVPEDVVAPRMGATWIPIPGPRPKRDTALHIIAWLDNVPASDTGLFIRKVYNDGTLSAPEKLENETIVGHYNTGSETSVKGFLLFTSGTGFNLYGVRAVVTDARSEPAWGGPLTGQVQWYPGLGNSGCQFVGNPTWVANNAVDGGQIAYAATLKEVGDWLQ